MFTDEETEYELMGLWALSIPTPTITSKRKYSLNACCRKLLYNCVWIPDTIYRGGDPISFYDRHADRISFIHVKGCDITIKSAKDANGWPFARAAKAGIMVEPGIGSIDFAALRQAMVKHSYDEWIVVEQDLFLLDALDVPLPISKSGYENLKNAGF